MIFPSTSCLQVLIIKMHTHKMNQSCVEKNVRKILFSLPLTDTKSYHIPLSEVQWTLWKEQEIILTWKSSMLTVLFHCIQAEKEQQVLIYSQHPLAMPQTTSLMKNPCGVVHKNLFKLVTVSLREGGVRNL